MPETIRDGKGRGYLAQVNADNQLVTRAATNAQRLISTIDGQYYEAITGKITLTDATETGIIYLKNTITTDLVIVVDRVFYDIWTSTGGSGADGSLYYFKNPTVTGGTTIEPTNTNFQSTGGSIGTFLKSLTTITGTKWWSAYITDKTSASIEEGRIVIPAGGSFGISVAAPTGNTSMDISINIAFYYLDTELVQ